MNLPAANEQQGQAAVQQSKSFPGDRDEALKFSNDILQILNNEQIHNNLLEQMQDVGDNQKVHVVGMLAGNLVGDRVADVRSKTGRPIEMRLVVDGLKSVIAELSSMAQEHGFFTMEENDQKMALKVAVDILDNAAQQQTPGGSQ